MARGPLCHSRILLARDLDLSDERDVEYFDPIASVGVNGQQPSIGRHAGVIGSGNRVAATVGQTHGKWPEWSCGHSLFDRFLCHVLVSATPRVLASVARQRVRRRLAASEGEEHNLQTYGIAHLPRQVAGLTRLIPTAAYVFTVRAKNWHRARDLSRRNAGPADPRWEIAMPFRQPTFLRTKARAPIAVPGETVNTYRRSPNRHPTP